VATLPGFTRFLLTAVWLLSTVMQTPDAWAAAKVDLGWLEASQIDRDWKVVRVFDLSPSANALREGDILIAADDLRLSNLNPLTVARILNRFRFNATGLSVLREGSMRKLQFPVSSEPLLALESQDEVVSSPVVPYRTDEHAPALALPDAMGRPHVISFDGKWTLIHIWNTGCDPSEVAALNEISNPSPGLLDVIGVAMNDTADSIKQFSMREPIEFVNLLGGDYDGDFARKFNYFALRTDILVNPDGRVVFVGNGPNALRAAWTIFRGNTSNETTLEINH